MEYKPCPFCGKDVFKTFHDDKYGYTFMCLYCGGRVASHMGYEFAIERWNMREN